MSSEFIKAFVQQMQINIKSLLPVICMNPKRITRKAPGAEQPFFTLAESQRAASTWSEPQQRQEVMLHVWNLLQEQDFWLKTRSAFAWPNENSPFKAESWQIQCDLWNPECLITRKVVCPWQVFFLLPCWATTQHDTFKEKKVKQDLNILYRVYT